MSDLSYIDRNLAALREELARAAGGSFTETAGGIALAAESGTPTPGCPLVVAAVKYALPEELEHLLALGQLTVGENRVQQLKAHYGVLAAHGAHIHFIGKLQTNKVKDIIDKTELIHSVDSLHLAREIDRRAAAVPRVADILIEINAAGERTKSGIGPAGAAELAREVLALSHLRLRGFMTMGPRMENENDYRAYFRSVRELGVRIWRELALPGEPLFSMGMSRSAGAAAKEGADLIRVGRRLFEGRPGGLSQTPENENEKNKIQNIQNGGTENEIPFRQEEH